MYELLLEDLLSDLKTSGIDTSKIKITEKKENN